MSLESAKPNLTDSVFVEDVRHVRRHLGQYFTPKSLARFMASWLDLSAGARVRLIEPGTGAAALTRAVLERSKRFNTQPLDFSAVLVERDPSLAKALREFQLSNSQVVESDFVAYALSARKNPGFTHAILNPPFVRLRSIDPISRALRGHDVFAPNLYAAFLWLALDVLRPGGELVAIVPRSFCNGKSFARLRQHLRENASLERLHLFESREVFTADGVLQETVVVKFVKRPQRPTIGLTWSHSIPQSRPFQVFVPVERLLPTALDGMIRIPRDRASASTQIIEGAPLISLDSSVSTGSVVDFRLKDRISSDSADGQVPLVDSNFGPLSPGSSLGKQFARFFTPAGPLDPHVFPLGNYVVVRRISPKEVRPRLQAAIVSKADLRGFEGVAFENHVNVIHRNRSGLTSVEASHLLAHLQSDSIVTQFEELSGTTQVNATDLRALTIPPR